MKTTVFRVVSQGDVSYVASQKAEGWPVGQVCDQTQGVWWLVSSEMSTHVPCSAISLSASSMRVTWWWLRCVSRFTR